MSTVEITLMCMNACMQIADALCWPVTKSEWLCENAYDLCGMIGGDMWVIDQCTL